MTAHALLLEGPPGVGKTTAMTSLAELVVDRGVRVAGFLTREVRARGSRVGFLVEGFGGERAMFATAGGVSEHRVGRYAVHVEALDSVVALALRDDPGIAVYLVDEIGKMECLSPRFVAAVRSLFDARRLLVATVAQRAAGFPEAVKRRTGVEVWTVSRGNRDELPLRALGWLAERW